MAAKTVLCFIPTSFARGLDYQSFKNRTEFETCRSPRLLWICVQFGETSSAKHVADVSDLLACLLGTSFTDQPHIHIVDAVCVVIGRFWHSVITHFTSVSLSNDSCRGRMESPGSLFTQESGCDKNC